MKRIRRILILFLTAAMLLSGCVMRTVDELYALPKRPQADDDLQKVIDQAMVGLSYSTPVYGENRQMLQTADLDGDGVDEYIVLARDSTSKSLKLLIFRNLSVGYVLSATVEGYGTAFDFVEFSNLDDHPGAEIIVGRQVGEGVVRSAAVYRLSDGAVEQLLEVSYSEFLHYDLDADGRGELLVIHAAESDIHAKLSLYRYVDGEMRRDVQTELSGSSVSERELEAIALEDGNRGILVTEVENGVPHMSVLKLQNGEFGYIYGPKRAEKVNGYYLYPTDVDGDGITEFPKPRAIANSEEEYWLVWYGLDSEGKEREGMYCYYNRPSGWYLHIDQTWAHHMSVTNADGICTFLNDDKEIVMTVYALTGSTRNEQAKQLGGVELARSESVLYVAVTGPGADAFGITGQRIKQMFYPIELRTQKE